jgi:hypothetical protein
MVLATAENETKETVDRGNTPSISYFERGRGGGWWEGNPVSRFERGGRCGVSTEGTPMGNISEYYN